MKCSYIALLGLLSLLAAVVCAEDSHRKAASKDTELNALKKAVGEFERQVERLEKEAKKHNDQMKQMNSYVETIRGQLTTATEKAERLSKENSEAETSESKHSKCRNDLKAERDAKINVEQRLQKQVEEVKRLEENLKLRNTELEEARKGARTAAQSTKQAQQKASEATEQLENTISKLTEKLEQQNPCGECILTISKTMESYLQPVINHPSVKAGYSASKEYMAEASTKVSESYVAAQPYLVEAAQASKIYFKLSLEKGQEAFRQAAPIITKGVSSISEASSKFMQSDTVVGIAAHVSQITSELKSLVKSQMLSVPSLAPFASQGFVDAFVYAILTFPIFLLLSFCTICSCKTRRKPQNAETSSYPTGKGKKSKKGSSRR